MLFMGIDAGGSRCRSRLVDPDGRLLGEGETGPANARVGVEKVRETLLEVGALALNAAGLGPDRAAGIRLGCGIAGISRPGVRPALQRLDLPYATAAFETDAVIANLGANGDEDGAILIIGTGSIAHVRANGSSYYIGGYGFPISDEGSGAALGLSAMRHALRSLDGRTKATPLSRAVTERFGHNISHAIAWMDAAAPKDYAELAPLVMDHAEAGDVIARSIVEDAALHIERFIETIFERGAPRCCLAGGLAPRMRSWLRARTVARLGEPKGDPLDGALILAGYRRPTAS